MSVCLCVCLIISLFLFKVVIITGANTGIGLVAAEMLAKDGYEVIMACRSEEKANQAVSEVQKKVPGAKVSFMKVN